MANYELMVLTKAVVGQRDELAKWYDTQHIPDHLRVPGYLSATRYTLEPVKSPFEAPEWDFLTVYELDGIDPMAIIAEAARRLGTDDMPFSPAMDQSVILGVLAKPAFSTKP